MKRGYGIPKYLSEQHEACYTLAHDLEVLAAQSKSPVDSQTLFSAAARLRIISEVAENYRAKVQRENTPEFRGGR